MNNKLECLLKAHFDDKHFISRNCLCYYCDVLSIVSAANAQEFISNPLCHSHSAYEFMIPYSPLPLIIYENAVYIGEAGYVYPVPSGRIHSYRFRSPNIAYDNIVIDKDFFEQILIDKDCVWKDCMGKNFDQRFELTKEAGTYIQYFKDEFSKENNCVPSKLYHLAALIASVFTECEFQEKRDRLKAPPQYQQGIHQIVSYMNQHYADNLQIDTLASMCGLSRTYFITAFRKAIGETPYNYLLNLRMAKARLLLENPQYSIKEIALLCGFQKPNTFSSLFKNYTGMTPTDYKQKLLFP